MPAILPDLLLVGVAVGLVAAYHGWLLRRIRTRPMTTAVGLTRHVRKQWVELVMAERRDVLAVQTLRNSTMAATFLASTAMLLALGILSVAATRGQAMRVEELLTFFGTAGPTYALIKLLILAGVFLFAFFNFALSLRYFNHAGFLLAFPPGQDPRVTPEGVAAGVNRGGLHYTLGMRGYYLSVPLALWLFGPELFVLGAAGLILILIPLDRP